MFRGKISGKESLLKPPGMKCTRGGVHADLDCASCHTSWAPQCISCHTSFDQDEESYDLLDNVVRKGAWIEQGSHFLADFPALGVVEAGTARKIRTFIPGMVMTLDKSGFTGTADDRSHHRLYAPLSAHTTVARGQGCNGCHTNPVALGYGRGALEYLIQGSGGEWAFTPQFPLSDDDGLPLDAWIGFLKDDDKGGARRINTTRSNARSFTLAEQQKILRVGACLICHQEESETVRDILVDFERTFGRRSDLCPVR